MAEEPVKASLSDAELRAGAEYLSALRHLGFFPEAMCWVLRNVYDEDGYLTDVDAGHSLAIVSGFADYAGHKTIYDLLFKAYDAAITPKELDPFQVTLYGPASSGGKTLLAYLVDRIIDKAKSDLADSEAHRDKPAVMMVTNNDIDGTVLAVPLEGIYVARTFTKRPEIVVRNFARFKAKVEKLAA